MKEEEEKKGGRGERGTEEERRRRRRRGREREREREREEARVSWSSHPRRLSIANIWVKPPGFGGKSSSERAVIRPHCNWRWGFNTPRAHTHTRRERERERERERDRGETHFFPDVRSPSPSLEYLGRRGSVVTLWDSSCRPCQTRIIWRCWDEHKSRYFPIILAKKRCARAARLPAVVETPLGKWSRDSARPIRGRVTSRGWHSSWWIYAAFAYLL